MPSSNKDNESIDLESNSLGWTSNIDNLLAKWCDEAKCFEWMHAESYSINNSKARKFMVSINLLTAVSGLSNVITGGFSLNGFQLSWLFGGISIIVSTLNMLQDKLGYQTRAEMHRRLSSQWGIITNKIEEIVIIPYNSRKDCKTFLKLIKTDINQLSLEGNPLIPEEIRNKCAEKFKNIANFDIPEICGQMEHTQIYIDPHSIKEEGRKKDEGRKKEPLSEPLMNVSSNVSSNNSVNN